MNMFVHHQKRRNFRDGTFVNIGEDACPYADNELLIVADGLGGRGGYPHTKINPEILNNELFYRKFIEPTVGIANDAYANFVTNSFKELFWLKGRYFSCPEAMRTSGYFASRLVTAIVLYAFKFLPDFRRDIIFENLGKKDVDEQKQYLDEIRNKLANLIQTQLSDIANRMGLELESKTKGSYLLPTTLVVAIMKETESGVDVLYIWAGDSRGYLWNDEGLAQITDDHERDETMTNLITLTKPFQLEARLFSTKKPVILFNATDGCYKCPCFASPFDLEYVFLQAISVSDNFSSVAKNLDGQFAVIGTHDDSNTMALEAFGYESFNDIKNVVTNRLGYLHEHIINKLPDILERDYQEELNQVDEQIEGGIFAVKDVLIGIRPIVEFAKQRMVEEKYAPYIQDVALLKNELEELDRAEDAQKENIRKWVEYYWLRSPCLKKYSTAKAGRFHGDSYEMFAEKERICNEENERYVHAYSKVLEELNKSVSDVIGMSDSILNLEILHDKDTRSELLNKLQEVYASLDKIKEGIGKGRIIRTFSRYYKASAEINYSTSRYVKRERTKLEKLVDEIIIGKFNLNEISMSDKCRHTIDSYIKALNDIEEKRKEKYAAINGLKDKYLIHYWNEHLRDLIITIRREHPELIPEEVKRHISANIGDLQEKHDELVHYLEIRNQLYDFYNKAYNRYFKESTL